MWHLQSCYANTMPVAVAGLCYLIDAGEEKSTARIAAVATFVYLFAAFYSPGQLCIPHR